MRFTYYLGIDVSKRKLDLCLFNGKEILTEEVCGNTTSELKKRFKSLFKKYKVDIKQILICGEFTGMYVYPLIQICKAMDISLWLENGAQIKLSSGIQRGKNDKIDAKRIAYYAQRFSDKANLYQPGDETIDKLKYLRREREMLVVDKAKYQAQLKDQINFMPKDAYKEKQKRLSRLIKELSEAIKIIEKQIQILLKEDDQLKKQYNQIISIDGVGTQTALETIIATRGFKAFNDPRKFCCHAGVAPFAYTSGSSQRIRGKVSNRANKKLKKLFHMAAMSSIKMKGEMKEYFVRKVTEGKNKMQVLNAVRGKLIHRIFAVIREDRKYEKNYINSLV